MRRCRSGLAERVGWSSYPDRRFDSGSTNITVPGARLIAPRVPQNIWWRHLVQRAEGAMQTYWIIRLKAPGCALGRGWNNLAQRVKGYSLELAWLSSPRAGGGWESLRGYLIFGYCIGYTVCDMWYIQEYCCRWIMFGTSGISGMSSGINGSVNFFSWVIINFGNTFKWLYF